MLFRSRSDDLLDYDIRNDEGKAILGDLKSGYLNSFGAFVASDLSRPEIDSMVKSKNLNDFYLIFSTDAAGGKKKFLQKVNQFDAINLEKIKLYHHYVQQLKTKLTTFKLDEASTQQLITILDSLTDLLYFRKKSS